MADDTKPMPADGSGTEMASADENGELASRRDSQSAGSEPNAGESGGGAYPNPHSGKDDGGFRGGQSDPNYYGKGQLGDRDTGDNPNAVAEDD